MRALTLMLALLFTSAAYAQVIPPSSSILGKHIVHVVKLCSQEKMNRIYAATVIACVKNQHILWNWSDEQFIRNTVSTESRSFTTSRTNCPISVNVVYDSCPQNASCRSLSSYLRKKAINQRSCSVGIHAISRAALAMTSFQNARPNGKCLATKLAFLSHQNFGSLFEIAFARAKSSFTDCDPAWLGEEVLSTELADTINWHAESPLKVQM